MVTPDFKITINGSELKTEPDSIQLIDENGTATDELQLKFDGSFSRPSYKDEIKVWLGYKESGLYFCGTFLVQTTTQTKLSLTVKATSTNFTANLKEKVNISYENLTLKDLVSKIASKHGLRVKADFRDVFLKHISQTNESDLHLLDRLAKDYNATFNIKNNTLIFIEKTKSDLPIFSIDKDEAENYSLTYANKTLYKSVKATFRDTKENKDIEVIYGSGEPVYHLRGSFKSKEEALKRAEGVLGLLNSGTVKGSLTCTGRNIIAGGKLSFDDSEYLIKRVTHTINGSGYSVKVEFEK